ncbi:MAG: hypothetical protein COB66_01910 [Coxiella sp. (in: Bacteria)]|nr:MAG: hypothetical protein COB66_01910 [Coxiella sp. (in: g-proteobacteria)]
MQIKIRFFIMLTLLMAMSCYIVESYGPSLPAITRSFHTSMSLASNSVSVYFIGFGLAPLLYAPFSDTHGRRPVVIFGIWLALASSIFAVSAQSITMLLIARFLQGLGMGVVPGVVRCMASDLSEGGRNLGRLMHKSAILFNLMPALAPIIGGYIQYRLGWRFNLGSVVILTLITLALTHLLLPETLTTKNNCSTLRAALADYKQLLCLPKFLILPCFSLATFSGVLCYLTYSPYFYQTVLHLNALENGLIGIVTTAAVIGGHYMNARLLKRSSLMSLLIVSGFYQFVAGLIMLLLSEYVPHHIITLAIPFFVFIIGDTGIRTNAFSHSMGISHITRSSISAIYSLIQFSGTGLLLALLLHIHLRNPFTLAIIFCCVGGFTFFVSMITQRGKHTS